MMGIMVVIMGLKVGILIECGGIMLSKDLVLQSNDENYD